MSETDVRYTGGCLCGALRYEASSAPAYMGLCFCRDCRKASGSGFIPFMSFPAEHIRITGAARQTVSKSIRGTDAVRNFCAACSSLVYGGIAGKDVSHTVYAGSLDDPALFRPSIAVFMRDRAGWALIPPGLTHFETLPG